MKSSASPSELWIDMCRENGRPVRNVYAEPSSRLASLPYPAAVAELLQRLLFVAFLGARRALSTPTKTVGSGLLTLE